MPQHDTLPVVVIGAGPIGLAAAAHLVAKGQTPVVLEAGTSVGTSVRAWGHVQVFSPWRYNIDGVAGTYTSPNPLGAGGVPAVGEAAARDRIVYGIPDVLDHERARYAGRRVLVVGSGHSAFNVL